MPRINLLPIKRTLNYKKNYNENMVVLQYGLKNALTCPNKTHQPSER